MKSLIKYIKESFQEFRCKDVEVHYKIIYHDSNKMSFEIPVIYSEDDFQIYIQDKYLEKLPGNNNETNDLLGANKNKLFDTLFEYSRYDKDDSKPAYYVEWDHSYDNKIEKDNDEFAYVTIHDFEYIMKFDEFDIKDESEDEINDTMYDIFKAMNITHDSNIPFDLVADKEKIFYK